jgi:outer membrane receptor protein involved in Fe transport
VYKYDGRGDYGHRDFRFQAEYLRAIKDLKVKSSAHPEAIGSSRKFTTDGVYAQAIYGFAPKWTAGVRYDVLGLTNEVSGGESAHFGSSDRWSLNVTWNPTEFSRLRAQYNRSDILVAENERERYDTFWLQFIMSLGAHGAHSF